MGFLTLRCFDSNYSMLLGQPWLRNAHVIHDWGNNLIIIEGNGTMQTITITKHLDNNTKCLKVLLCYNLMEGVTDEEVVVFATKPNLFTFGTITLLEPKKFSATIFGTKISTQTLCSTFHILKDRLDNTFACIRVQELVITCWILPKYH